MMSILKLVLGAILRFVWDRAEEIYQRELKYQTNKRILINEVKDIARKVADSGDDLRVERESVDDSFVRLERIAIKREPAPARIDRPIFGNAYKRGTSGDSSGDSVDLSEVSPSDDSSAEEPSQAE